MLLELLCEYFTHCENECNAYNVSNNEAYTYPSYKSKLNI